MDLSPASFSVPHALQPLWDRQLDSLGAEALRLALEYQLFTHLDQFTTPATVAHTLQLDPTSTSYFMELLWSMDLLEKNTATNTQYRNLPISSHYLNTTSPAYCGDALLFRHQTLRHVSAQLDTLIRTGKPAGPAPDPAILRQNWANAARVQIAQEQRAVTANLACRLLAAEPSFKHAQRLLDLGGGPGLVAIALAQLQPQLTGNIFEHQEAADVAADMITEAGLQARLHAIGGDLERDDIGRNYDIIWCSSVLHFVADIPAILRKLYEATAPGGMLVCAHAEVPAKVEGAKRVLPYYLHMRIQGRHVLPEGLLTTCLEEAGFILTATHRNAAFPIAPLTVLIATKPRE